MKTTTKTAEAPAKDYVVKDIGLAGWGRRCSCVAAPLVSLSTLRRKASIRLMTLVWRCVGCGVIGMPFCLERISSISALS